MIYYFVNYLRIFEHETNSMISDIRMGIIGTNLFIIYIACLILPKPSIYRPHPGFWRLVQALAFAYLINITFWLFLSKENLQYFLQNIVDPSLKNYISESDYAVDCRIYTPENPQSKFYNIINSIDVYIVCHFVGWLVKAWIFRNTILVWSMSISFELLELSFRYWYVNFNECWWDSLV